MSIAFLFPGQGSQAVGMGSDVFNRFPELVEQANETVGYSLSSICLEDADRVLGQTQFTQPALYLVSFLAAKALIEDGNLLLLLLDIQSVNLPPWPPQVALVS